jgi:hypothetical protein
MNRTIQASLLSLALTATALDGAQVTYSINANGAKEVTSLGTPNQGDSNGTAIGTLTLDNVAGTATFNIAVANIDGTFSGHHIHNAVSTTTGPIVLDFGNPLTILTGTPMSGVLSGIIGGLNMATINAVFANPANYYYNLHTTPNFPGGAVRDQLSGPAVPESGATSVLMGLALLALFGARRRFR